MSASQHIQFREIPGLLFRRLHQLAVSRFAAKMEHIGLTPIQWSVLVNTLQRPGLDQSSLSREIYIDTSTVNGVVDRLEARGLIQRRASPVDRRLRLLYVTEQGQAVLEEATATVIETQGWLLEPLSPKEQAQFMALIRKVLDRTTEPPTAIG
jgi:DNA-binding MarR family transcriptional regulator